MEGMEGMEGMDTDCTATLVTGGESRSLRHIYQSERRGEHKNVEICKL
jgi:hypothetical protein